MISMNPKRKTVLSHLHLLILNHYQQIKKILPDNAKENRLIIYLYLRLHNYLIINIS